MPFYCSFANLISIGDFLNKKTVKVVQREYRTCHFRKIFKVKMDASGGENTDLLPVPAVFLINSKGKIAFSYVNPDFRERLSGETLIQTAKAFLDK